MSVETKRRPPGAETRIVGVDLELQGALVARAGARCGRVVAEGETLADVVEAWADDRGAHVRFALLDGDRLRSGVVATRQGDDAEERLVAASRVRNGDTVRFSLRD